MNIHESCEQRAFSSLQPGDVFRWPQCDRMLSSPMTLWVKAAGMCLGTVYLNAVSVDGKDVLMDSVTADEKNDFSVIYYPDAILKLEDS